MTVSVPAQYQGDVSAAAKALGIPEAVVAAQIGLESSWDPTAVSPAGAEGIAQFEPGTFDQYGPKGGSPFNVSDAFAAYVSYMRDLLHQEGGDLRKALEAYNAGPGNLGAGAGYASTILARAGTGDVTTSGGSSSSSGGHSSGGGGFTDFLGGVWDSITGSGDSGSSLLSWPAEMVAFFGTATDELEHVLKWFQAFTRPSTYVRIGSGAFGALFLLLGIVCLARETRNS